MDATQPGFCVGDDHAPDGYELRRRVRAGGEGEVWQASSIRQDATDHQWAVKILHPHHLLDTDYDETLGSALNRWHDRLRGSLDEIAQLRHEVPGIVGPARVFLGDQPHPPGEPGTGRTLYVVSTWIEGHDLGEWRRIRAPSFEQICAVLAKLAAIVDGLARRELVHRDISPGNVIVGPRGQVSLIDCTFTRPSDSAAGTVMVVNRGYTAPEAQLGQAGPPADRYSFGAVASYLLSRAEPARENAAADCRAVLIHSGFSVAVADHVAGLLRAEPGARPESLAQWTATLSRLGHRDIGPGRYRALTMSIDSGGVPVITAANAQGAFSARLGVGLTWRLSRDQASPAAIVALAAVTDGSGTHVVFALNDGGAVFVNRSGQWSDLGLAVSGTGIAAIRDPHGLATAYVVDPARHEIAVISVGLDGVPRRVATGRPARRVLSATTDHDGTRAILFLSPGGQLACISADGTSRVSEDGAFGAAGCVDRWGELRCYQITAGQNTLTCFDRTAGEWAPIGSVDAPLAPTAVACVGHREGVTIALAGHSGLYVTRHGDHGSGPWQSLTRQPCTDVRLEIGAAWRVKLAALAEGRVVFATEDFDGGWSMGLTRL